MIGSLRGRLLERFDDQVLIEVAGVGYRVSVTPTTAVALGDRGAEVFVHIHHHIREDAQTLYGFPTADERSCFEALIGAHGVGPTLGLAILAVHPPASLRRVLADDDLASLCLVPGVGKKTAARLLVELKPRLVGSHAEVAARREGDTPAADADAGRARVDVRDALANLGYGPDEVAEVLGALPADGDASELLRLALQRLAVR